MFSLRGENQFRVAVLVYFRPYRTKLFLGLVCKLQAVYGFHVGARKSQVAQLSLPGDSTVLDAKAFECRAGGLFGADHVVVMRLGSKHEQYKVLYMI